MENDVFYFRLINTEQIAGRILTANDDYVVVEYPMLVENKHVEGIAAINLGKYLPFSAQQDQFLSLRREHIIAMSPVSSNFCAYWHNTIQYQMTYMQPQMEANMVSINKSLEAVLSNDNQKFLDAMRKYELRMPTDISDKVH